MTLLGPLIIPQCVCAVVDLCAVVDVCAVVDLGAVVDVGAVVDLLFLLKTDRMDRKIWEIEGKTCSKAPQAGIKPGCPGQDWVLMAGALPGEPPGPQWLISSLFFLKTHSHWSSLSILGYCRSSWQPPWKGTGSHVDMKAQAKVTKTAPFLFSLDHTLVKTSYERYVPFLPSLFH